MGVVEMYEYGGSVLDVKGTDVLLIVVATDVEDEDLVELVDVGLLEVHDCAVLTPTQTSYPSHKLLQLEPTFGFQA